LPPLTRVLAVNGEAVERAKGRSHFERLTQVFPDRRYRLGCLGDFSMRVLDVVAPIGKGQRGLIVAPPKAGKTTLLYKIAQAIRDGYPEVHLMMALIAERPEEATFFEREVGGELIVSTLACATDKSRGVRAAAGEALGGGGGATCSCCWIPGRG